MFQISLETEQAISYGKSDHMGNSLRNLRMGVLLLQRMNEGNPRLRDAHGQVRFRTLLKHAGTLHLDFLPHAITVLMTIYAMVLVRYSVSRRAASSRVAIALSLR